MRGLLIKDISLMIGNARVVLSTMGIGVIYVFLTDVKIGFAMSYMVMLFGTLVLSTIAYDEENGGMSYLMTLPVSRYQYVLSKYLFLLLFMVVGAVMSLAVLAGSVLIKGIMDHSGSLEALQSVGFLQQEEWVACAVTFIAVFLLNMFLMPLRYKFGVAMQQVMVFAVVASVIICAMVISRLLKAGKIDLDLWLSGMTGQGALALALLAVGLCAASFLVSLWISSRVMARKEF